VARWARQGPGGSRSAAALAGGLGAIRCRNAEGALPAYALMRPWGRCAGLPTARRSAAAAGCVGQGCCPGLSGVAIDQQFESRMV